MKPILRSLMLWCSLSLAVSAQTTDKKPVDGANKMLEASKFRGDLVKSIIDGEKDADASLERLRQHPKILGVKTDAEADFAVAAVEIGHRLIGSRKDKEAERFFRAADDSLSALIARSGQRKLHDLVQYLQIRASIRANFLNMPNEARADLDEAIKLSPEDKYLVQQRRLITADPAETLRNHKELPVKG